MGSAGWIKLHRSIKDNSIWKEDTPYDRRSAWVYLLTSVNHEPHEFVTRRGVKLVIEEGQMLTSVRKLSNEWHWGKDKTLRYLLLLESCNMIRRNSETYGATLISIVNWAKYQGECDTKRDTKRDSHKDTHQPRTRNNKNNKEIKKEYTAPQADQDECYSDEEWAEMCKAWREEHGTL